jgi:Trk-type K+ transport system membrane component
LLGIAPQILTVPAIMVGNCAFVMLLALLADKSGKNMLKQIVAWITAAAAKFAVMYATVVWLICGVLSQSLLAAGVMKPPMLKLLPATFSWPQLFTALIGGGIALLITPVLRKALRK